MIAMLFQENMVEYMYRGIIFLACVIAMASELILCARYCVVRIRNGREEATQFLFRKTIVLLMCMAAFVVVMVITGIALTIGGGM